LSVALPELKIEDFKTEWEEVFVFVARNQNILFLKPEHLARAAPVTCVSCFVATPVQ
jgi:hypothetical protein